MELDKTKSRHLLSYIEAIHRVFNRHGRRDSKYKARIKILIKALGVEALACEMEEEWQHTKDGTAMLNEAEYRRVAVFFAPPAYDALPDTDTDTDYGSALARDE